MRAFRGTLPEQVVLHPHVPFYVVCAKVVHFVVDKRLLYSTFVRNQRRRSNWKYVMKDSKEKQISCIWETAKPVRWVIFKKWGRRRRRENSLITMEEAYLCPDSTNLPTPHPLSNFPMMMNYFIKLWSILIAINFDFSIQSSRCLQQEKQDVQISCPFQRAAKS